MDPVTRCLHCGKRMVPAPSYSGRTELKCVFCDKLDSDLERWFPDGVDTAGLVLIKVRASSIQYWDGEENDEILLNGS